MALQHRCDIIATLQRSTPINPLNPLMVPCLTSPTSVPELRPRDLHYIAIGQQSVSSMSRSNIAYGSLGIAFFPRGSSCILTLFMIYGSR
ncbi:hypothetical protein BDV35DRAFT_334205 [Aspergillus flavus]|uniref:Uncharacterized protein n=1 Tax=Aspergillus flavus TaxID=5059 RepID=A0A5N6HGT7_ASPFL|nr:hypothetical protein BDV35DRAFT_334205 [Aspergillus flavus]